ncbi:hypothetical protein THAOC_01970, partial [Thalassiosira oceanica]
ADGPVPDDCSQEKGKKGVCFEAHQLDDSAAHGSLSGPERRAQSKKPLGKCATYLRINQGVVESGRRNGRSKPGRFRMQQHKSGEHSLADGGLTDDGCASPSEVGRRRSDKLKRHPLHSRSLCGCDLLAGYVALGADTSCSNNSDFHDVNRPHCRAPELSNGALDELTLYLSFLGGVPIVTAKSDPKTKEPSSSSAAALPAWARQGGGSCCCDETKSSPAASGGPRESADVHSARPPRRRDRRPADRPPSGRADWADWADLAPVGPLPRSSAAGDGLVALRRGGGDSRARGTRRGGPRSVLRARAGRNLDGSGEVGGVLVGDDPRRTPGRARDQRRPPLVGRREARPHLRQVRAGPRLPAGRRAALPQRGLRPAPGRHGAVRLGRRAGHRAGGAHGVRGRRRRVDLAPGGRGGAALEPDRGAGGGGERGAGLQELAPGAGRRGLQGAAAGDTGRGREGRRAAAGGGAVPGGPAGVARPAGGGADEAHQHGARLDDGRVRLAHLRGDGLHERGQREFSFARMSSVWYGPRRSQPPRMCAVCKQNCQLFAELYSEHAGNSTDVSVVVPRIYPEYCTENVLVMEWIDGKKLTDVGSDDEDEAVAENLELIRQSIDSTLSQLLVTGVMHADPHAGNLLKIRRDDGSVALGYLDFGILSTIPERVRDGLTCAVALQVFERDADAVASLFGELMLIPQEVLDDDDERSALAEALEVTFEESLLYPDAGAGGGDGGDEAATGIPVLKFDKLLDALSRLVPRFRFDLPPYFINNARALSTLEGIAKGLDPGFNVLEIMYPYALGRLLRNPSGSPVVERTVQALIRDVEKARGVGYRQDEAGAEAGGRSGEGGAAGRRPPWARWGEAAAAREYGEGAQEEAVRPRTFIMTCVPCREDSQNKYRATLVRNFSMLEVLFVVVTGVLGGSIHFRRYQRS